MEDIDLPWPRCQQGEFAHSHRALNALDDETKSGTSSFHALGLQTPSAWFTY